MATALEQLLGQDEVASGIVEALLDGTHRLARLTGPSGAGKSHTARLVEAKWRDAGGRVLIATGDEAKCGRKLFPLLAPRAPSLRAGHLGGTGFSVGSERRGGGRRHGRNRHFGIRSSHVHPQQQHRGRTAVPVLRRASDRGRHSTRGTIASPAPDRRQRTLLGCGLPQPPHGSAVGSPVIDSLVT